MTHDMLHVTQWHDGAKALLPFTGAEIARRQAAVRDWLDRNDAEAALFTAPACIGYFSGWLHRPMGRRGGLVLTATSATTIAPAIDGGEPWRQSHGPSLTYTDWRRDNFYRALRHLTAGVRRLAIDFGHVTLDFRRLLDAALPGVEMVDIGAAARRMQLLRSAEEIALLTQAARIAALGLAAGRDAVAAGVPEFVVASAASAAMAHATAAAFGQVEPMAGWATFRSGFHTDAAHGAATNRRIAAGDILSLACCPVLFGYPAPLGRTCAAGPVDAASLAVWRANTAVHRQALTLIRPGARCNEIAAALNDLYRSQDLLQRRSASYGHSVERSRAGDDGRGAVVDLREDCDEDLRAGMVLSVGPMVRLPDGVAGAGGYRDRDLVVVTDTGAETLTAPPLGPDHWVL